MELPMQRQTLFRYRTGFAEGVKRWAVRRKGPWWTEVVAVGKRRKSGGRNWCS